MSRLNILSHSTLKNRADWIRTSDLLNPIQAHYQAVLRPDIFEEPERNGLGKKGKRFFCLRGGSGVIQRAAGSIAPWQAGELHHNSGASRGIGMDEVQRLRKQVRSRVKPETERPRARGAGLRHSQAPALRVEALRSVMRAPRIGMQNALLTSDEPARVAFSR